MPNNKALGRGLSSLIPAKKRKSEIVDLIDDEKILRIKTGEIETNPFQPREKIGHEELEELINSIKEHGILQPLILTKGTEGYSLIAGERRLKAAKIIGLKTVPAIIRDATSQEKLELALVENLQRKNLNPLEEAVAFQKLVDEFELTQEQIAKRVGKSRESVSNTLRILSLPLEIQKGLAQEKITEGHAKAILGLPDEKKQLKLFKKIINNNLSVRKTENFTRQSKKGKKSHRGPVEPSIIEKEDKLRGHLGTKVEINKRGKKGKITIQFYSQEELNSIVNKIIK